MRLFKATFVAASAISLMSLVGCATSDEGGSDMDNSQSGGMQSMNSDERTRPGHYEIVTSPDGQRETPYKASQQDHTETITHPGGTQQKIWQP